MTEFSPQTAIETLRTSAIALEELGHNLVLERVKLIRLRETLADSEQEARNEYFNAEVRQPASILTHLIKQRSHEASKAYNSQRVIVENLKTELETLQERINLIKAAHKISLTEITHLNLT